MFSLSRPLVIALLICLAAPDAAQAAPPTEKEIARWVEQLGDNNFATREKAMELLWNAGRAAEPAVRKALESKDAEVVRRAGELMEKFKWGIYPDTPKDVLERINRYQTGDRNAKLAAVRQLLDLGGPGCAALAKISKAEEDPAVRRETLQLLTVEAGRAIPFLVAEGNFATLDDLFELNLAAGTEPAVVGYSVYWLLRGRIDDKIAEHKTQADKGDARAAEVLTFLCRVKGDLKTALWAARKSGKPDLEEMILYDQGDWKALAGLPKLSGDAIEALSYKAAYCRLAGDQEQLAKLADEIRRYGEQAVGDDRAMFHSAEALLLNGRVQQGLDMLQRRRDLGPALDLLSVQLKHREAIELADKAKREGNRDPFTLEIVRARALHTLGETEEALKAFKGLGDQIPRVSLSGPLETLVSTEYRLGLKDLAYEHFARALPRISVPRNQSRAFGLLFPERAETAEAWWRFLRRRYPQEDPLAAMKKVRELLDGKLAGQDLDTLIREAEQQAGVPRTPAETEEHEKLLAAVADVLVAAKKEEQAQASLEKAAAKATSPWPGLRLGDLWAEKKQWDKAAEQYRKAHEKNRKEPLPLFLSGWAMTQAGQKQEGSKLMDLARVVPLGDETARQQFAAALAKRGHREEALREHELVVRLSRPTVFLAGESQRQLALHAVARKDYLQAADYYERVVLRILKTTTVYLDGGNYVIAPCQVHSYRALGLLKAGKIDDARKEIALSRAILPNHTELPILLVPELDKLGHKKDAQELFNAVYALHEKNCADNPKSAAAHNSLAWLAARCRRNIDKAVEHARKATELAPTLAGYSETLAEAYFQHGDKDKAVEAIKKCIELEPKRAYYQKQLKRIEAGDPKAPLPEAGS